MNKSLMLLAVVVLVASIVPSAPAGEAALMCKYSAFSRLVKVTPKQEKAMQRILGELDSKLKTWDSTNRAKKTKIETELATARKGRNMKVMCDALNKKQALQAERTKLAEPYVGKLVAELSTRQRGVWEGEVLYQEMHKTFNPFRLDETQIGELRTRSDHTGLAIAGLRAQGMAKEMAIVRRGLAYDIVQDVLTAQQRERFAGSGDAYATGPKETPEQRAERIKLAAMGFNSKRLAADVDRTSKAVRDALDESAAANDSRWTDGMASGKTTGASDLMKYVNTLRGASSLPGSTQMNFSAQTLADQKNGLDKQNKLGGTYYGSTGSGGYWVVGPKSPEAAYNFMRSHFNLTDAAYTGLGAGRRGRAWALVFTKK